MRNRSNGLLASPERGWTRRFDEARQFPNSLAALAWCFQNDMRNAEIVVRFSRANSADIVVPVSGDEDAAAWLEPLD